jgi:hypothetical protein
MTEEDPAAPQTKAALQDEFKRAQRRRLMMRGVAFWRDTDLPERGPIWTEDPPAAKVE